MDAAGSGDSLHGLTADPLLLSADPATVPGELGQPPGPFAGGDHERLVGAGAALTGTTLVGGTAIVIAGLVALLAGRGVLGLLLLVVGLVLAGTHWGWVHIAQMTADARDRGVSEAVDAARAAWLAAIAPYPRWEVRSHVRAADAAVVLERARFAPVPVRGRTFTFERTVELSEAHADDVSAAVVSERAEEWRRAAALDTARAREAWAAAADAEELDRLSERDDAERLAAAAAASRALSEQINAQQAPLSEE